MRCSSKGNIESSVNSFKNRKKSNSSVVARQGTSKISDSDSGLQAKWNQEKSRPWDPYENGEYNRINCEEPNEVNFIGGLGPNVGHTRSKVYIKRPTEIHKIYNMRTQNRRVFTFCEDASKTHNVPARKVKVTASDTGAIVENIRKVKYAQNIETPPPSYVADDESAIVIDEENPLDMDFQGLDQQETIRRDEQEYQNKREYYQQHRNIGRVRFKETLLKQFERDKRQEKYALPEYYNIDKVLQGDESIFTEPSPESDWHETYRSKVAETDLVFNRPMPEAIPFAPPPEVLAQLVRSRSKPKNIRKTEKEQLLRQERFLTLENRKKEKLETLKKIKHATARKEEENLVMNLGEKEFEDFFKDEYAEILKTFQSLSPVYKEQKFPHTLRETNYLKCLLNSEKRIVRDKAEVKTECYQNMGLQKIIPEKDMEADDESCKVAELSEQSTDDEDNLSIGVKSGDKYQLRGFHYKLDTEPRGLRDVKHKSKLNRTPRGCIARADWFNELAPAKGVGGGFFANNFSSLPCKFPPESENYQIFEPEIQQPKSIEISPIKEAITNKLTKRLKQHGFLASAPIIKKPKTFKVKRFNLTAYLFSSENGKYQKKFRSGKFGSNLLAGQSETMKNYEAMCLARTQTRKRLRHNRMKALGIPIVERKHVVMESESGSSTDSEWVPEVEMMSSADEDKSELSKHPRRKKIPETRIETVPSKHPSITRLPYDVPILSKMTDDIVHPPNLELRKMDFTVMFNVRHHHEHHDTAQHKVANVKYNRKIPKYQIGKIKLAKAEKPKPFDKAMPRGNRTGMDDIDLSLPQILLSASSSENEEQTVKTATRKIIKSPPPPQAIKTRDEIKPYPEKEAFVQLLREKNVEFKSAACPDDDFKKWFIDRDKYLDQLKCEIESIKSCNTSETSSMCTNFTLDSGSFLLVEGKKVPCDYVTKSQIPFEEIDRCRVKTGNLDHHDEYYGPYYHVPYAGQKIDMRKLTQPKDKFFTATTRSRFGVRDRLEVKVPRFSAEQIGTKEKKFISRLATEWDEYYINEIKTRPRIRKYKPRTMMAEATAALRKNFVVYYAQKLIIERIIAQNKEVQYAKEVERFRDLFTPLFMEWKESHYRSYMGKMQRLKEYYNKTDDIKHVLLETTDVFVKLDKKIIYTEDIWRNRVILQNLHYLVNDMFWRFEHDWIHRMEDGSQENYRSAIKARPTKNVRARGEDSARAVKHFYENVYEKHPVLLEVNSSKAFLWALLKVKMKTFVSLLELHFSMWIQSDLESKLDSFESFSKDYLDKRTEYVKGRCTKKYYIQDRCSELQRKALDLLNKPLKDAISEKSFRKLEAMCGALFDHIIPKSIKDNMKEGAEAIDRVKLIAELVINIFEQRDGISPRIRKIAEQKIKSHRAFITRQAIRSCALENCIHNVIQQMTKNLAPPYKPPPRIGKLPRSRLPEKKKTGKVKEKPLSDSQKLFYKAFTDVDSQNYQSMQPHDTEIIRFLEASCIPFYFDYFLKQHDYFPDYNFKTEIDAVEGPEWNHFKYKDVLITVKRNIEAWEKRKQSMIAAHIKRTWHLYIADDDDDDDEKDDETVDSSELRSDSDREKRKISGRST